MQRKDLLKKSSIRNAEYYDMIGVQDRLYAESAKENDMHLKVIKDNLWIEGVSKASEKVFCDEFVRFAHDRLKE